MEFAPKASMEEFIMTMKLASIPIQEVDRQLRFQRHNFIMDRFVERIHTQEARRYRDAQVESLKRSMEYALENEKFKGEIDDTKKHGD
jgi:hypothetical protein